MVAKIIRELKSHMIPKFKCSHWLKLQHSDWRANLPPMRALEFLRDHVTFKLPYDFSYHMKTPIVYLIAQPEIQLLNTLQIYSR